MVDNIVSIMLKTMTPAYIAIIYLCPLKMLISGMKSFIATNVKVINIKENIAAITPCDMKVLRNGFMIKGSVAPTNCILLTVKRLEYIESRTV